MMKVNESLIMNVNEPQGSLTNVEQVTSVGFHDVCVFRLKFMDTGGQEQSWLRSQENSHQLS